MSQSERARIVAITGDVRESRDDSLATEEPLEIQIHGVSIAVLMRTPGDDEDLVRGFLITERIVACAGDITSIRHCTTVPSPDAEDNVVRVTLRDGVAPPLERLRRNLFASSSCGVCGKATIEAALSHGAAITSELSVDAALITKLPALLRAGQRTFDVTGGLHAAALFDPSGTLIALREDVGRHCAVDKIVGAAVLAGIDPGASMLFVSGRIGFELVQKAAAAQFPIIAGISAPTSLAVSFAVALGVTVVGFVRGDRLNVYSHARRVVSSHRV